MNVLEVNHLTKRLVSRDKKNSFTLSDIDFAIEPGYIVGLIGNNGAGKTTLLNTILGIYVPDEGSIIVEGSDRVVQSVEAKQKLACVMDECLFPLDLTPKNIGKMFGPCYPSFDYDRFMKLCRRFGVPERKTLRKMSKGTVVKVQLAFALSREAAVYILDEPTAGLDPVFRKELMDYLFELVSDGKRSVLFSTHLTEELDRIADYILYLDAGRQLLYEDKETLLSQYQIIRGTEKQVQYYRKWIVGSRITEVGSQALIRIEGQDFPVTVTRENPTIEDIMYFFSHRDTR